MMRMRKRRRTSITSCRPHSVRGSRESHLGYGRPEHQSGLWQQKPGNNHEDSRRRNHERERTNVLWFLRNNWGATIPAQKISQDHVDIPWWHDWKPDWPCGHQQKMEEFTSGYPSEAQCRCWIRSSPSCGGYQDKVAGTEQEEISKKQVWHLQSKRPKGERWVRDCTGQQVRCPIQRIRWRRGDSLTWNRSGARLRQCILLPARKVRLEEDERSGWAKTPGKL